MKAVKDAGVTHQRTGYNNPNSNVYIERFFRTLKEQRAWLREYNFFY